MFDIIFENFQEYNVNERIKNTIQFGLFPLKLLPNHNPECSLIIIETSKLCNVQKVIIRENSIFELWHQLLYYPSSYRCDHVNVTFKTRSRKRIIKKNKTEQQYHNTGNYV